MQHAQEKDIYKRIKHSKLEIRCKIPCQDSQILNEYLNLGLGRNLDGWLFARGYSQTAQQ